MAKKAYVWDGTSWISIAQENMAFPDQTGNSGKYLTTNGVNASWAAIDLSTYATTSYVNTEIANASGYAKSFLLGGM